MTMINQSIPVLDILLVHCMLQPDTRSHLNDIRKRHRAQNFYASRRRGQQTRLFCNVPIEHVYSGVGVNPWMKNRNNTAEKKTSIMEKFQIAEGPHALKAPELKNVILCT